MMGLRQYFGGKHVISNDCYPDVGLLGYVFLERHWG